MAGKQSLVERFGKLPAGMSKADMEAVLQFLYGAFDRQAYTVFAYLRRLFFIEGFRRWRAEAPFPRADALDDDDRRGG